VRDIRVGDKGFIRCVNEDHGVVGSGVIDPFFQFSPAGHHPGRVVGKAEIDNVHLTGRQSRDKAVGLVAGEIDDVLVVALSVCFTGAADHDIGIVVDRINRITDSNNVVQGKDVEDVGTITL